MMQSMVRHSVRFLAASSCLALFLSVATSAEMDMNAKDVEAKPLLKANQTNVGRSIELPDG